MSKLFSILREASLTKPYIELKTNMRSGNSCIDVSRMGSRAGFLSGPSTKATLIMAAEMLAEKFDVIFTECTEYQSHEDVERMLGTVYAVPKYKIRTH